MNKSAARATAKQARKSLKPVTLNGRLINHLNSNYVVPEHVAGFAPLKDEIDIWPLLHDLHLKGHQLALPVVTAPAAPLIFRHWSPDSDMATDRYGVKYPASGKLITPQLVLVPLLAFTSSGKRLGYGGGYYDRTLDALRSQGDIFACGVAYAGQEVDELPTDEYDQSLDGILTEDGFRTF